VPTLQCLTCRFLQLEGQTRAFSDQLVSKVAERVPARSAGSLRVHLTVPEMVLQRTSRLVIVDSKGCGSVDQKFNFQLTAPVGSEMRV
jgi:hypothetical protein